MLRAAADGDSKRQRSALVEDDGLTQFVEGRVVPRGATASPTATNIAETDNS